MKADVGITRGRNIHLWPIFYRDKTDKQKNVQIAASVYRYQQDYPDSSVKSHFLPFYTWRKDSARTDLRIGTIYYPTLLRFTNRNQGEFRSFKAFELLPEIDLAEFTSSNNGEYKKKSLLFLYWRKNDTQADKKYSVLFPLYFRYHSPNHNETFSLLPLVWHDNDMGRDFRETYVFPNYYNRKEKDYKKSMFFPLYYNEVGRNIKARVVFPLYWYKNDSLGKSLVIPPVYGHFTKTADQSSTKFYTPLYWTHADSTSSSKFLFPLFNQLKSSRHGIDSTQFWIFPSYYYNGSVQSFRQGFFPVWSRTRSNGRLVGKDVIFPLYFKYFDHRNGVEKDFTMVFPFYSKGKMAKHSGRKYGSITPLYWYVKDPQKKSNFLIPFYWRKREYLDRGIKDFKRDVLFPVVWRYKTTRKDDSHYLKSHFGIFPLLAFDKQIIPGKESRFWGYVTPLYVYRQQDSNSFRMLFPIGFRYAEKNSKYSQHTMAITPLFWSSSSYDVKKDLKKKSLYILPLYSRVTIDKKSERIHSGGNITPVFYYKRDKESSGETLFPIYWRRKDSTENYTSQTVNILPLFSKTKYNYTNGNRINDVGLFPLYLSLYRVNQGLSFSTKAYSPLVWSVRRANVKADLVFPLYLHINRRDKTGLATGSTDSKFIFPLWYQERLDSNGFHLKKQVLFPLYWRGRAEVGDYKVRTDVFFPLVWVRQNGTDRYTGVLPFYYAKSSADGGKRNFLWQLYRYKWKKDEYRQHNILGPIWKHRKYDDGGREFRFLHLLYANVERDSAGLKSVFPVYFEKHDSIGNRSKTWGAAFYNYFQKKLPGQQYFYREERIFWILRIRSNAAYLRAKGIEVDRRKIRSL